MPDTTTYKYLMNFQSMDGVLACMLEGDSDESACIIDSNKAVEDLLGYPAEQLSGMNISTVIPGVTGKTLVDIHQQTRSEHIFITRQKTQIPIELDIHPVSTQGSHVWLLVARDITERKKVEAELIQARIDTADANRVKTRFLSNMSHELRTPLNGIMGMTQIMLGTNLSKDQEEYLNLSLDATRHLTRILNDLLELSNIEEGGLSLSTARFDLRSTLYPIVHAMTMQAKEKNLKFEYIVSDEVPNEVYGDHGKIRQVLVNLLFNAIKFTHEGDISLTLSSTTKTCSQDNSCEVSFIVKDTGMGIESNQHEAIFDSFTLGESIMTKQYGGIGLGLSISRQLAEFMGGSISLQSTPGKGSVFTFTVPLSEHVEQPAPSAAIQPPKINTDGAAHLRILLAEDEQVNSIMASRLLRKVGHEVAVVGNGQQAMEALGQDEFDIILMDVQMPVINGIQATQFIRNGAVENVSKDIPIIGLTAFAQPEEKQQFMAAGMNRIVTKPYEPEELMQAVASYIA